MAEVKLTQGAANLHDNSYPGSQIARIGNRLYEMDQYGLCVQYTATLTSAAAATAVTFFADSVVDSNKRFYLQTFVALVNGGTLWATTATVTIQDSAAVAGVTFAVAGLTANAILFPGTANITYGSAYSQGTGFTLGKGMQIVGNANGTGSNLVVTITGIIK